ncbi:MAG: 1-acyl-sn-glycerol-3-phosphate acyltransferase [Planctomycetaceae bacterium]|nr:1-acyl-sn-glycerol-3-phosphate acyltransferase [Planctomycetaceae bacterium]
MQVLVQVFVSSWMGYRTRGLEHLPAQGGALLLVNHRSFLDPLLAGLPIHRPVSYVARHNLFFVPFLGPLLNRTYVIPINRDAVGTSTLREIVRRLDHGFLVGLFPEGTRHSGPEPLGTLKPGFVSILRRANTPVIPIGIAGAERVLPRGTIFIHPKPIRVVFGKPIPREQLEPLCARGREEDLLEFVSQRMAACVTEAQTWLSDRG